jgi:hypothetical protein
MYGLPTFLFAGSDGAVDTVPKLFDIVLAVSRRAAYRLSFAFFSVFFRATASCSTFAATSVSLLSIDFL